MFFTNVMLAPFIFAVGRTLFYKTKGMMVAAGLKLILCHNSKGH